MMVNLPFTPDAERRARNAQMITILSAIASGVAAAIQFASAFQAVYQWQLFAGGIVCSLAVAAFLVAYALVRSHRPVTGMWVSMIAAEIEFLALNFFLSGLGLVSGIGIMLLTIFAALATMPQERIDAASFSGLIGGLLTTLADAYGLDYRLAASQALIRGAWAIIGSLVIMYLIIFARRLRDLQLRTRLTLLIILILLPLIAGTLAFLAAWSGTNIEAQAAQHLEERNTYLSELVTTWLDLHVRAARQLALQPDIISMDPVRQKPVLVSMTATYPEMYLVHTLDMSGFNVARSDENELRGYSDRIWFQRAAAGEIGIQVVISRTINRPALSIAAPIRNARGEIIGVCGLTTTIESVSAEIVGAKIGETGYAYVVDENNFVIAHPDPAYTDQELFDLSNYPPVVRLRQDGEGLITFTDENGVTWRAYVRALDNGWGIVVQQTEAELLAPVRVFQRGLAIVISVGVFALVLVTWFTLRRALAPIRIVTETASAIAEGELERVVPVTSGDEIGVLGTAFNQMAARLRELIGGLEARIAERTAELTAANERNQRRAVQFEAIAQVAHSIASLQNLEILLPRITELISERFGFYHVGIFLLDNKKEFAVLMAANSEGGKRMLARRHSLKVGETGIVGNVAFTGIPRIALDVDADAVFFQNPDLPATRSEIALPLQYRDQIIGVLDMQSTQPIAFQQEDVAVFSTLADQIAVAIENARLFSESQSLLAESQKAFGGYLQSAWQALQAANPTIGYNLIGEAISALEQPVETEAIKQAIEKGVTIAVGSGKENRATLTVPIRLRGKVIGVLDVKMPNLPAWDPDNVDIAEAVADRLSLAIETAILLDESRRRADTERIIGEVTSKISSSVNLQNVLQTTVKELGRVLPGSEIILQFQSDQKAGAK